MQNGTALADLIRLSSRLMASQDTKIEEESNTNLCGGFYENAGQENDYDQKTSLEDQGKSLTNYLYTFIKSQATIALDEPGLIRDDDESIYEDEDSETKTIFRSSSYDELVEQSVFSTFNENNTDDSFHSFRSDDFCDMDSEQKRENTKQLANSNSNVLPPKLVIKEYQEDKKNEYMYLSIGSGESVQFDDVILDDIICDCSSSNSEKGETKEHDDFTSLTSESEIQKIVDTIVMKLKLQLEPKLRKLSKEAEKYSIIKQIYNLPSISNINEEIKKNFNPKPKSYSLEFHDDVIREMVGREISEYGKVKDPKKGGSSFPVISANDQVKLNFNKYRKLDPIVEEDEISLDSVVVTYNRDKDRRKVKDIESDELINILRELRRGTFPDLNKVNNLVSLFEGCKDSSLEPKSVNTLSNKDLKQEILKELHTRNII